MPLHPTLELSVMFVSFVSYASAKNYMSIVLQLESEYALVHLDTYINC